MFLAEEKLSLDNVGLAWGFRVSPSSCDNPEHYENYIRFSALSDYKSGMGVTRLLVDCEDAKNKRLAGYVTLRATSLVSSGSGEKKNVQPALEIAELAVHEDYERKGVGTGLVAIAIDMADVLRTNDIGIKHILVCSDPKSVGFYKNDNIRFAELSALYDVLYDGWNDFCTPLIITLPELTLENN